MREYIVTYKQKYEDFTRKLTYHADFINDAMKQFYDDNVLVTDWVNIKEYKTPYCYIIKWEGDHDTYIHHFDTFEDLMHKASYIKAFDDCAPHMELFEVWAEDVEIVYDGWRPNMHYVWRATDTGEVVWDNCYPSWDH